MSTNKFEALINSHDGHDSDEEGDEGFPTLSQEQVKDLLLETTVPEGHHQLQSPYCLWYSRKASGKSHQGSFDQNLQLIGSFATCEQFWNLYSRLIRPGELTSHSDFHLFKKGIKPLWEDELNRYGGKWIVRLRKGLASRCWENLIMAMLGEQFMVGEEICGAVVSVRYQEDILSIWNRSANDTGVTNRIRDTFRRVLNLPPGTTIEYKAHNDSINLSFLSGSSKVQGMKRSVTSLHCF